MNCTGNCNQGRLCTCAPARLDSEGEHLMRWLVFAVAAVLVVIGGLHVFLRWAE